MIANLEFNELILEVIFGDLEFRHAANLFCTKDLIYAILFLITFHH